jgi:hypothetical protein
MNFLLSLVLYTSVLTITVCSPGCILKKKVIIDTGTGGLGNRLIALASAALLAIITDRELEVIWKKSEGCDAELGDLFDIKKPSLDYSPLVVKSDDDFDTGSSRAYTAAACYIHLDGGLISLLYNKMICSLNHFIILN